MRSLLWIGDRAIVPLGAAGLAPEREARRTPPRLWAAAAVVIAWGLSGCSQSYVVLEIFAGCPLMACTVPDQADGLDVTIFAAPASGDTPTTELTELGSAVIELTASDTFPYDVLMRPSTTTPQRLRNVVNLRLGGTVVGATIAEHDWREGSVTRARITVIVPGS